jgi:hypothetical protein
MSEAAFEDRDSMSFSKLLAWAWRETPPVHKNGTNLVIHIFAVPLFVLGHLFMLAAVVFDWWLAIVGLLSIIVSIALQGFGHSMEPQQVPPFTGSRDFVRRLYAEQFCNFWRFLFSGQWYSSFRAHNDQRVA